MATLSDIIKDPNYVNANAATKKAIFDKYAPQDPNYSKANAATQEAIRIKFGVAVPRAAEPEGMPGQRKTPLFERLTTPQRMTGTQVTPRELAQFREENFPGAPGVSEGVDPRSVAYPLADIAFPAVGAAFGGIPGAGGGYAVSQMLQRPVSEYKSVPQTGYLVGKDIAIGSLQEAGGRLVGPTINMLAKGGAKLAGKAADITDLPNILAAKTARESLGSPQDVAAARAALQAPEAQSMTAQQALAQGGVISPSAQATMEKAIVKTPAVNVRSGIEAAQEASRKSTIQGITPDLDAAISARRAASKPLYEAADRAVVPIDAELTDVISRMPEGTLAAAANIAKMEGRPFIMGKGQEEKITGESLHYIKRALGDIAYGPAATTGIGRDAQLAARALLDDYVKVFESKVPAYGQARRVFSDLSAPVNQAQVLREMVSVLEKPGGGERIGQFLNVLGRGEQAMLKRAGGRGAARFESLAEVLTPEQIGVVRGVARQLEAETKVARQVSDGQQRATELLKDALPNYRLPNIFNVLATTANKFLDTIGTKVGQKTMTKLADASLSAKSFDELLAVLPGDERIKVLKAMQDPDTWAPVGKVAPSIIRATTAAAPETPTNALAGENSSQNALRPPL